MIGLNEDQVGFDKNHCIQLYADIHPAAVQVNLGSGGAGIKAHLSIHR